MTPSTSTFMYLSNSTSVFSSGSWTVMVWFLAPFQQTGAYQTLIGSPWTGITNPNSRRIAIDPSGNLGTYSATNSTFYSAGVNVFVLFNTSQWHHLAVAADATGPAIFYIDGVAYGSSATAPTGKVQTLFTLNNPGSEAFMAAGLYKLQIFVATLTQSCIQNAMHFDQGVFGKCTACYPNFHVNRVCNMSRRIRDNATMHANNQHNLYR